MQKRRVSLTLLALLFAFAIGAGLVAWTAEQRVRALRSSEKDEMGRINQIAELVSSLGSVQLAYSASPQTDEGWFGHVSRLVEHIETNVTSIRENTGSDEPSPQLRALRDATSVVVQATARARDSLASGRDLMATDLVLGETRASVEAMATSLRQLRSARAAAFETARNALEQRAWTVVGVVAGLWALGLFALAWFRGTQIDSAPSLDLRAIAPLPESAAPSAPGIAPIDLSSAAALCTAISRVTTADEVPDLLARAATILDATGIIVWIGAGDRLVAIGSHGYAPGLINRISPIPLSALNPTTATWHAGETRTVPSEPESNGAIAIPMWGPIGCVGVLAAEVRNGRENDGSAHAVMEMIAAQLSTAIAPATTTYTEASADHREPHSELPVEAAGA